MIYWADSQTFIYTYMGKFSIEIKLWDVLNL